MPIKVRQRPLLKSLGIESKYDPKNLEALSAEERAAIIFMGAAVMVAGKGMAMTPKWRHIDDALLRAGAPQQTLMGGSKGILIHPNDPAIKKQAIEMMARATQQTGSYISGPDQNVSAEHEGGYAHVFADAAPFHMVGSSHAHEMMRGRAPSNYTGDGVYEGVKVAYEHVTSSKKAPVFIQGNGGVGSRVLARTIEDGGVVAGVSDADISKLAAARDSLDAAGMTGSVFVWDRAAARKMGMSHEDLAANEQRAMEGGFEIADGLIESMEMTRQKTGHTIAILSPNAGSHPVTMQVLEAAPRLGIQAIVGGANNMLALDEGGSYMPAANRALELNVFVPNDSAINRLGAAACLFDAVGLTDATSQQLTGFVGERVGEEWFQAHQQGIPPQVYSDALAMQQWNSAIYARQAIGGLFAIPAMTPMK